MSGIDDNPISGTSPWFPTTHWSVVMAAGEGNAPAASEALEALCRTYWYPLYAFVRRRGYAQHQAEDLTQGFFADFLSRRHFSRVDPSKGKLRSYLSVRINLKKIVSWF